MENKVKEFQTNLANKIFLHQCNFRYLHRTGYKNKLKSIRKTFFSILNYEVGTIVKEFEDLGKCYSEKIQ